MHENLCKEWSDAKFLSFPDRHALQNIIDSNRNYNKDFIARRMIDLDLYLTMVLNDYRYSSCHIVLEFLGAVALPNKSDGLPYLEMHVDMYYNIAEAGDMILFQTPGFLSSAFRTVSGANWDHVGIVVNGLHGKALLEATVQGVTTFPLRLRLTLWDSTVPEMKIAVRKLNIQRTPEFHKTMDTFCNESVGLEYSLANIIKGRSDPETELERKNETFFCSELVAKLYKCVGVLPASPPSSSYHPETLAKSNEELGVLEGISFEDPILITFSKSVLVTASEVKSPSSPSRDLEVSN